MPYRREFITSLPAAVDVVLTMALLHSSQYSELSGVFNKIETNKELSNELERCFVVGLITMVGTFPYI